MQRNPSSGRRQLLGRASAAETPPFPRRQTPPLLLFRAATEKKATTAVRVSEARRGLPLLMMAHPSEKLQAGPRHWQEVKGPGGNPAGRSLAPRLGETPAAAAAAAAAHSEEELECRICRNFFDAERHVPQMLACLHTFCLECLSQLHLRASSGQAGGTETDHGDAGAIACPLCRHLTVLPDGRVLNLVVNTKRAKTFPRPREDHPPLDTSESARQRPLPERSGGSLTPAIAAAGEREAKRRGRQAAGGCCCCCCVQILLVVGLVSGGMAVFCGTTGFFHDKSYSFFLPIFIFVSVSCFLTICSIVCCCPSEHVQERTGNRGELVVSSTSSHHFVGWGEHAPGSSASEVVVVVDSGWGGSWDHHPDVSYADCGFSGCTVDSGGGGDCGGGDCGDCGGGD